VGQSYNSWKIGTGCSCGPNTAKAATLGSADARPQRQVRVLAQIPLVAARSFPRAANVEYPRCERLRRPAARSGPGAQSKSTLKPRDARNTRSFVGIGGAPRRAARALTNCWTGLPLPRPSRLDPRWCKTSTIRTGSTCSHRLRRPLQPPSKFSLHPLESLARPPKPGTFLGMRPHVVISGIPSCFPDHGGDKTTAGDLHHHQDVHIVDDRLPTIGMALR
jgi:hypothetical protein